MTSFKVKRGHYLQMTPIWPNRNLDLDNFPLLIFLNHSHRIYSFAIFSQLIFVLDLGAWTENLTAYHSLGSLNAPFLSQFRASLIWLRFCNSEIAASFWLADRVLCEVTLAKFKCLKWPRDQSVPQFQHDKQSKMQNQFFDPVWAWYFTLCSTHELKIEQKGALKVVKRFLRQKFQIQKMARSRLIRELFLLQKSEWKLLNRLSMSPEYIMGSVKRSSSNYKEIYFESLYLNWNRINRIKFNAMYSLANTIISHKVTNVGTPIVHSPWIMGHNI